MLCVDEDTGGEVHGVHCDVSQRPADQERCSLQPCEYVWITGEWSEVRPGESVSALGSAGVGGNQGKAGRTVGNVGPAPVLPEDYARSDEPLGLPGALQAVRAVLHEPPQFFVLCLAGVSRR